MKVSYIYEKGIGATNDDAYIINDVHIIYGVTDGATGLDGMPGNIASQTVQNVLTKVNGGTLMDRMKEANDALRYKTEAYFAGRGEVATFTDIQKSKRSTTGSAVIQFNKRHTAFEYVHAADCMIFLQYENDDIRPLTYDVVQYLDQMALREFQRLRSNPSAGNISMEQTTEKIKPLLIGNRMKLNTKEGYGIIDGSLEALDHLEYGKVSLKRVKKILLLTDGLQMPLIEGETGTWGKAAEMAFDYGIEYLFEVVNEKEISDPNGERYTRLKMQDDKTAILLEM